VGDVQAQSRLEGKVTWKEIGTAEQPNALTSTGNLGLVTGGDTELLFSGPGKWHTRTR